MRPFPAAAAVAVLLAACGGGAPDDASLASSSLVQPTGPSTSTSTPTMATTSPPVTATPPPAVSTSSTTGEEPPAPPATEVRSGGGATDLAATSTCRGTPPGPTTEFTWQPSGRGNQRIDVAVTADGFTTGAYESVVSDLPPTASSFQWLGPFNEATNHWRVVVIAEGTAFASETATFVGPGCVGADMQEG